MEAMDEDYYEALNDTTSGYSKVKCVTLLKHLQKNYGGLREKDIRAYQDKIKEPWDESKPLESVFNRITRCMTTLAYTTPVCDRAAVLHVVAKMKQTGHFADAIKEWNRKPLNDRSFAESRIFFIAAEEERQETETTGEAGYHAANSAATDTATNRPDEDSPALTNYCHTHGLTRSKFHTSCNCKYPAEGHKKEANILLKATKRKPPSPRKWEAAPTW